MSLLEDPLKCGHAYRMAVPAQHVEVGDGHAFVVCVGCGLEERSKVHAAPPKGAGQRA